MDQYFYFQLIVALPSKNYIWIQGVILYEAYVTFDVSSFVRNIAIGVLFLVRLIKAIFKLAKILLHYVITI